MRVFRWPARLSNSASLRALRRGRTAPRWSAVRPGLEALETRALLTVGVASIEWQDGQVLITGTAGNDVVEISTLAGERVFIAAESGLDVREAEFALAAVAGITFRAGAGDDVFLNRTSIPSVAFGETGRDELTGGDGDDELYGHADDDLLRGSGGNDLLNGGAGDDIIQGGTGDDRLFGEGGQDQIWGDDGDDDIDAGADDDRIWGGTGHDSLKGASGDDTLEGEAGDDSLIGHLGDDLLAGGPGLDTLDGMEGNDRLFGEADDDLLRGGSGADQLDGGPGNDTLYGQTGDDRIDGGDGEDSIHGGEGNDVLAGGAGGDEILDSAGDDLLLGGTGNDSLSGDDGNDVILGGDGDDQLRGGSGADILIGGLGADTLNGGGNDDLLLGSVTDYDDALEPWQFILQSWTSETPYEFRIAGLEHPTAPYRLQSGMTVHDDAQVDSIWGLDGRDWFFLTGMLPSYAGSDHGDHHGHAGAVESAGSHAPASAASALSSSASLTPGRDLLAVLDTLEDHEAGERIHSRVPHAGQPVQQREHLALFDLVPYSAVTHVATASGPWSSPETWYDGIRPSPGANVLIPSGVTVVVDAVFATPLRTVRVDGKLQFDAMRNTSLRVDTLVVDGGGTLEMGTADHPIQRGVQAEIRITGDSPIDRAWDPLGLSRGVIVHGRAVIHGAETTPHAVLATAPRAGETELVLDREPVNWRVGDRLVLAGTRGEGAEDEELQVLGLEGRVVHVAPLRFDHVPPRSDQSVHLIHLTRNAVIRSENETTDRRGHVMFMHTRRVDIGYAGFFELGRTDKRVVADDAVLDDAGALVAGSGTNPRGRYAVHFHRNGTVNDGFPSHVVGSAVVGSPGWGYVSHSSFVEFADNVAYNVSGAAFVTEAGDEIGSFAHNVAIHSVGSGEVTESRVAEQDFGHEGDGFWLQGGGVSFVGNVAAGQSGNGLILFARGLIQPGLGITEFPAANLKDRSWAQGAASISVSHVPVVDMSGNTVYASRVGAQLRYHLRDVPDARRGVVEDLLLWNNTTGLTIPYTHQTDFRRTQIVRDFHTPAGTGVDINILTRGITYEDLTVEGYLTGLRIPLAGENTVRGGSFNNLWNIVISSSIKPGRTVLLTGDLRFGTLPDAARRGHPQQDIVMRVDPALLESIGNEHLLDPHSVVLDYGPFANAALYYLQQAADHVPFPERLAGIPAHYVGHTNAALMEDFGVAVGGQIAPDSAVEVERIVGLVDP